MKEYEKSLEHEHLLLRRDLYEVHRSRDESVEERVVLGERRIDVNWAEFDLRAYSYKTFLG